MADEAPVHLLSFSVARQAYALLLGSVERVLCAAEAAPLPKAPPIVSGVLNLAGDVIALIDVRKRLGLPSREIEPEDRIILARCVSRRVGLLVDSVGGVVTVGPDRVRDATDVVPGLDYVRGIVALEDGLLLISDLDAFLSLEEAAQLDRALEESRP